MTTDRRSSWLKGVLDLLVLACLRGGESYGYEIAKRLDGAGLGRIKGGTLYPVLNRLEEAEFVTAEFRATERGPGRRYYRLTARGREALAEQSGAWLEFHRTVNGLLAPLPDDGTPPASAPAPTPAPAVAADEAHGPGHRPGRGTAQRPGRSPGPEQAGQTR